MTTPFSVGDLKFEDIDGILFPLQKVIETWSRPNEDGPSAQTLYRRAPMSTLTCYKALAEEDLSLNVAVADLIGTVVKIVAPYGTYNRCLIHPGTVSSYIAADVNYGAANPGEYLFVATILAEVLPNISDTSSS